MITSKLNPKIRYYSQSQPSKKEKAWSIIANMLKDPSFGMNKYPNPIESHRNFVRQSYQKKMDEIKHMKERYSFSKRRDSSEKKPSRSYTERSYLLSGRTKQSYIDREKVQRSVISTRRHTQVSSVFNSIHVTRCLSPKVSILPIQEHQGSRIMSPFQQNQMKRLKIRQTVIMKKKMDSLKNDSRRIFLVNPMKGQKQLTQQGQLIDIVIS